MINPTSTIFAEKCKESGRTPRAKIVIGQNEIKDGIKNITYKTGSCGSDSFAIGSVFSSYAEIELTKQYDFLYEGCKSEIHFGFVTGYDDSDNEIVEYAKIATITAGKINKEGKEVSFIANDDISLKMNGLYESNLSYPCYISDVIREIGESTGVFIRIMSRIWQITIEKKPIGYTYREVLGFLAGLLGGFATTDSNGNVCIYDFEQGNISDFNGSLCWSHPTIDEDDYTVTGLKVVVTEDSESEQIVEKVDEDGEVYEDVEYVEVPGISYSYGENPIVVENPLMTEEIFDSIKERVVGITYRPLEGEFFGDPRIEAHDSIRYTDVDGSVYVSPCMELIHSISDRGMITSVTSPRGINEESVDNFSGPLQNKIDRLISELVVAKEVIAKKLTADSASIGTLLAKSGIIDNLKITEDLKITGELEGLKITGDLIIANTLKIKNLLLEGDDGLIYQINLLSGDLTAEQLADEKYKEKLSGTAIVANSVTSKQINVEELFATEIKATNMEIGGNSEFKGTVNLTDAGTQQSTSMKLNVQGSGEYNNYSSHLGSQAMLFEDSKEGSAGVGVYAKDQIVTDKFSVNAEGSGVAEFFLPIKHNNHDSAMGNIDMNNATSSAPGAKTSLQTGTTKTEVASWDIGPGVYIFTASLRFESNGTGRRFMNFTKNDDTTANIDKADARNAVSNEYTIPKVTGFIKVDSTERWRMNAYQNSGSTLSISPRLSLIRIL